MSAPTPYKTVNVISPTPSGLGGQLLNSNFMALADTDDLKAPIANPTFTGTVQTAACKVTGIYYNVRNILGVNYTATTIDDIIKVDTQGTSRIITLPAASTLSGKWYLIYKISATGGDLVTVSSASTIVSLNGSVSNTFGTQYSGAQYWSDGTVWVERT